MNNTTIATTQNHCVDIDKLKIPADRQVYEFYLRSFLNSAITSLTKEHEFARNSFSTAQNLTYNINKGNESTYLKSLKFSLLTMAVNVAALQPDFLIIVESLGLVDALSKDNKDHKALKLLWHYLLGGQPDVRIDTGKLLQDDRSMRLKLESELARLKIKGENKLNTSGTMAFDSGKINISPDFYSKPDWRWALGGAHFWYRLKDENTFIVSFNKYWYFKEYLDHKELRPDHSIHNVMARATRYGAKNFNIIGTNYEIKVD